MSLTNPEIAVVTVGQGNRYRQPSEDVVARYERSGAQLYPTDRHGAIVVTVEKDELSVQPWTSLLLQRIALDDRASWGTRERENWKRAWERIWLK